MFTQPGDDVSSERPAARRPLRHPYLSARRLALQGESPYLPRLNTPKKGEGFVAVSPKDVRRTGAGLLGRSRSVGDNWPASRHLPKPSRQVAERDRQRAGYVRCQIVCPGANVQEDRRALFPQAPGAIQVYPRRRLQVPRTHDCQLLCVIGSASTVVPPVSVARPALAHVERDWPSRDRPAHGGKSRAGLSHGVADPRGRLDRDNAVRRCGCSGAPASESVVLAHLC